MKQRINTNRKKRRGGGNTTDKDGIRKNMKGGMKTEDFPMGSSVTEDGDPPKRIISNSLSELIPFFDTLLKIILFLVVIGLCYYLIQNRSKIWGR